MAANFSSVPILDFSLVSDPLTKPAFIKQLQDALINVGFLYLKNHPVPLRDVDSLIEYIPRLFDLPQEAKDRIVMANSPHFLGYNKLGMEFTKGEQDYREQFDFATPHETQWKPGAPEHIRLWGPAQWPDENLLPGFKATMERYLLEVQELSYKFIALISEALGLPANALNKFYDRNELMQHRGKVVKYPANDESSSDQGVGPHYDAGFLTFLLQASSHPGLQVQNLSGQWIDAPPIPGTFVVNFGKAIEFVTQGLVRATSHRVLSPPAGSTPRYSVPFFQNISLNARLANEVMDFPPEVLRLKEFRGDLVKTDSVNFSEFDREPSGKVNLIGRVKSHPDVAERHYPDLFKQYFPNGIPKQVSAY
ncbi:Clavaminate synthase-like protein [Coniophora puteana RWD-64-598 SS2]|uniref:Clavaminate synthase-like protein n=1 Tax=Coniophora puteana (strain RWD-64-598) TaxID=741705 RepID=A0A5M3MWX8_CONPW|nr:Clavaminate synthase-like protein [Coniophora puteana RWD-64-598 SS2]EIW83111.1 Clavaminate synthase-like protein [Coniophora puteana RWD-64-598 SS2]